MGDPHGARQQGRAPGRRIRDPWIRDHWPRSKLLAQHGEHVGVEHDAGGVAGQDQRAEPEVAFGAGIGARYQLDSGPPQEPGLDEHGKAYGTSELDHVFSLGPRGPIEELLGPESVRHEAAPDARGSPS